MKQKIDTHLAPLGVYGFGDSEPAILAALVTEDPLLLIGRSGTGKTHLLNTLSEALGLEHRHYNASLVSFDDLVGFPFPDGDQSSVRFLETPATVWPAQSVLVDEISRCKPEHQNRLFSLVHERRIQGIALPKLRFRWAAMNPCSTPDSAEDYAGSEPLDRALADRFGLIVEAVDWADLTDDEQLMVADPSGEGKITERQAELADQIDAWRKSFLAAQAECPRHIVEYARAATSALNLAGTRVSPRRARMLARSLLAAEVIEGGVTEQQCRGILERSLPHVAWGQKVPKDHLQAAHRAAWAASMASNVERWIHGFHLEARTDRKLQSLLRDCPDPETGTVAVCQFLATGDRLRAGVFAFAAYAAAIQGRLPIQAQAVSDLGRLATSILKVDVEVSWEEPMRSSGTTHPGFAQVAPVLESLEGARKERAVQLLYWALGEKIDLANAEEIEAELERCVEILRERR